MSIALTLDLRTPDGGYLPSGANVTVKYTWTVRVEGWGIVPAPASEPIVIVQGVDPVVTIPYANDDPDLAPESVGFGVVVVARWSQGTDHPSWSTTVALDSAAGATVALSDLAPAVVIPPGTVGGGGAVDSVNGQTGVVVLDASDVGALPDSTTIPAAQVQTDWDATTGLASIANKPTLFSGAYGDLAGKPTLGTAAAQSAGAFATAAQGAKADTAVQPAGVHNIPAGGTTGQVLAKTSGTDYATGWADQSGGGGAFVPMFPTPALALAANQGVLIVSLIPPTLTVGDAASGGGGLSIAPLSLQKTMTASVMSIYVTTAGSTGAKVRAGIWEAGTDGQPGALVWDSGALAADTDGVRSVSISSPNLTLDAGDYWLGVASDSGVKVSGWKYPMWALGSGTNSPFGSAASFGAFKPTSGSYSAATAFGSLSGVGLIRDDDGSAGAPLIQATLTGAPA